MFVFDRLRQSNALIIANDWKYEEPYSFYDMTSDMDDYNEIVNEQLRNGSEYFEATVDDELVGFFSLSAAADEIEIGLGLRPDCCGRGLGRQFLADIIDYVNRHYSCGVLCVSVASFNKRAVRVYEACGFSKQMTYMQQTNGGTYEFIKMTKRRETPACTRS